MQLKTTIAFYGRTELWPHSPREYKCQENWQTGDKTAQVGLKQEGLISLFTLAKFLFLHLQPKSKTMEDQVCMIRYLSVTLNLIGLGIQDPYQSKSKKNDMPSILNQAKKNPQLSQAEFQVPYLGPLCSRPRFHFRSQKTQLFNCPCTADKIWPHLRISKQFQ